jgi:hypothetical protein
MKKALGVLLILAVAGGAFAEGLTLGGEINYGLGFNSIGIDSVEDFAAAFGKDSERWQGQFRLNGAYVNEAATSGVKFRVQLRDAQFAPNGAIPGITANYLTGVTYDYLNPDPDAVAAGYLSPIPSLTTTSASGSYFFPELVPAIAFGFGYINLLDDILTLQGGIIDDGTFATSDAILGGDVDEGLGTQVIVRPISGLSLGVGVYAGETKANPSDGARIRVAGGNNTATDRFTVDPKNLKYTLGVAYEAPELAKFTVSYLPQISGRDAPIPTTWRTWVANPGYVPGVTGSYPLIERTIAGPGEADKQGRFFNPSKVRVGANILALSDLGLTLNVAFEATELNGDFSDFGTFNAFLTVAYKITDDLNAGLNFALYTSQAENQDDPVFAFWLWGQYAINSTLSARLDADIVLGSYPGTVGSVASFDAFGNRERDPLTGQRLTRPSATLDYRYHNKFFTTAHYNSDEKLIAFRPSFSIKVDKNSSFEIGDLISIYMDSRDVFQSNDGTFKNTVIKNAFYVDYKFVF